MTDYIDADLSVRAIGARTDPDGLAVDDLSAREDALIHHTVHQGVVNRHGDGWTVTADGSTMQLQVGSGSAFADLAVVESDELQQPPYLVRLNQVSVTVQVDASGSTARTDSVWLIVEDTTWDSSGRRLARLAYRNGTTDPDPVWHAPLLLATVAVGASVTAIHPQDVTDQRPAAGDWAPRGTVRPHATSMGPVPSGWLVADGTNGTPDLRDRFIVGAGSTYADGATGGAATVALTTGQLPSHTHSSGGLFPRIRQILNTVSHNHAVTQSSVSSIAAGSSGEDAIVDGPSGTLGGSTAPAGSGQAHNNLPPYLALVYIVHP